MKRVTALTFLLSLYCIALGGASAQSKSTATIPFNFRVGSVLMPGGTYEIRHAESNQIWLYSVEENRAAIGLSTTTTGDTAPVEKLVFNKYGNQFFLARTVSAHGNGEMTFGPSRMEKSVRAEQASLSTEEHVLIATK